VAVFGDSIPLHSSQRAAVDRIEVRDELEPFLPASRPFDGPVRFLVGFSRHPMRAAISCFIALTALALPLAWLPAGASTQPAPARPPITVSALGPQVGQPVPEFSLSDQNGKVWTRDSIMGPKGAMLVFFRSADW
jgi:hypothetical protein